MNSISALTITLNCADDLVNARITLIAFKIPRAHDSLLILRDSLYTIVKRVHTQL